MWWLSMTGLLAVSVLIYVGSAAHVVSFSPLVTQRAAADRDAAVEAARAEAQAASTAAKTASQSIRLRTSGGPAGAEQAFVPVPPDAQVLSPGARSEGGQPAREDRLLFRTRGSLADVMAFYRDTLPARGWHEVRSWMSRPTTGAAGIGSAISAFCWGVDRPALLIGVLTADDGSSEVRVLFDADREGPCAASGGQDSWTPQPPQF